MLSSILLYLEDQGRADPTIQLAVRLAKRAKARLRGVALVDTRHHQEACTQESAVFATRAYAALLMSEQNQQRLQHKLSAACLQANVNFDIRKYAGDPMEVLTREARFHDLVVTAGFVGNQSLGLTSSDLIGLVKRSSNPLLVLHPNQSKLDRVLLVYDGSESAGRAIRTYLRMGPFDSADHRLLAIGNNQEAACELLREMGEYCDAHCPGLECGYVVGRVRQVLVPYVNKWQADLAILGSMTEGELFHRLFGDNLLQLLRYTSCAWWASN